MGVMRQLRKSLKKNQRYEAVRRKVRSRGGSGKDVRFVSRRGGKKMSDTLLEFAGPLIDPLAPYSEQEDKIALAASCWNLSLMPSEEKDEVIGGMFSRFKKELGSEGSHLMDSFLGEMLARKKELFPNDKRAIVEWNIELLDDGDEFLSVAYSLANV